ncbi:hypothetical protein O3Q52_17480 [Streptomyces sp. ActVer]|uniref:hypothetical protein n=1 Tax=Streptomyces sp. ActVer TaxID=3014558 RepID=UPI0022B4E385|nr:hypothetical protein [Streptomyces sp. ActVer]MCZ4509957.1 hypothetical protein [Streptomyces sp. ActVer]
MAKISRHGGASDDTLPVAEEREHPGTGAPMQAVEGDELTGDGSGEALPPVPDEAYPPDAVPLEGGDESSPGSSSSASTDPQPTNSEPSETPTPSRARKTASRSRKGQTDNSSAGSTASDQTEATSETAEGGEGTDGANA